MLLRTTLAFLTAVALTPATAPAAAAQDAGELGLAQALQRHHPELSDLLDRSERAHGILFGELVREGEAVRTRGGTAPTSGFEAGLVERLTRLVGAEGGAEADAAAAGYTALGARAAEVVRWGQAFQREVISILADPGVANRSAALANAVRRYRSRPTVALPSVPKNMDILYGHAHALGFRLGYSDLDGLIWAGHWLRLAATEPLTDFTAGPERTAGVDTVMARYRAKLSFGEPPAAFPTEIPLAPAIAPGFIWLSPESAIIWDNLSMLLEVLADVLASPQASDVPAAIEATVDFFTDPEMAITDRYDWEIMALRHGIFHQGGYPLGVMTQSERNMEGHGGHLRGGRMLMTIPGMPGR